MIFGIGLEMHEAGCSAGIYLCIIFYSSSKFLIYAFLSTILCSSITWFGLISLSVEKVHVVWAVGENRFRSPVYIICAVTVGLYAGVIALLFFGGFLVLSSSLTYLNTRACHRIPRRRQGLYVSRFLIRLLLTPGL